MNERTSAIIERISNGEKVEDLAVEYGISKQRVYQVIKQHLDEVLYENTNNQLEKLIIKYVSSDYKRKLTRETFEKMDIHNVYDLAYTPTLDIVNRILTDDCVKTNKESYTKLIKKMQWKALIIINKGEGALT